MMESTSLDLAHSVGATQVAVIVAALLEGVLTLQTYIYYNAFYNDPLWLQILVGIVFILDLIHLFAVSAMQYLYVVTHFNDGSYLMKANWGFDVGVVLTTSIAFLIQSFFVWRIWKLTKSAWMTTIVSALSIVSFGTGLTCGVLTFVLEQFQMFYRFKWLVSLWLTSAAFCDIFIAGILCRTLWKSKTGFSATDTLLNRLIIWTLNTGSLTSVIAIADTISFATRSDLVHFSFNICLGKLYANMFMATLNRRLTDRLELPGASTGPSGGGGGLEWKRGSGSGSGGRGRGEERLTTMISVFSMKSEGGGDIEEGGDIESRTERGRDEIC